jgi:FkbM family methyltransferase
LKKKCILFGASNMGKAAYYLLKDRYSIIGFCDNDSNKWGKQLFDIDIFSPSELSKYQNVEIIITSSYYMDISKQLFNMGREEYKIFQSHLESRYKMENVLRNLKYQDVLTRFDCWEGVWDSAYTLNFLGVKTRKNFHMEEIANLFDYGDVNANSVIKTCYPPIDEEYFEWLVLLESIIDCEDKFTMMELGAGYGRWVVRGAFAAKKYKNVPYHLVALEAEPSHYQMLLEHFKDNDISVDKHDLLEAAVSEEDGEVDFIIGNAQTWYGQSIKKSNDENATSVKVRAISLTSLLKNYTTIDLIDMDIQGSEFDIIGSCNPDLLNQKVKRIHIGTHGREIEINLRAHFSNLGWRNVFDFPCNAVVDTDLGRIGFQDGVQSWKNPYI